MGKANIFFNNLLESVGKKEVKLILVTHLLPDRPPFLEALSKVFDVALIIPKAKTIDEETYQETKKKYNILKLDREKLNNPKFAKSMISKYTKGKPFIISDIGGYFSKVLPELKKEFQDNFLGVIEDTENGHQKYEKLGRLDCPVFSVARSPLKYPEDILVAYSTVYSAERVLRERNEVLSGKKAVIYGYGKIGQFIARDLARKQVKVKIFDIDPIKMVHAYSEGYEIVDSTNALKDVDLVFCVTGNRCLDQKDLLKLEGSSYIFSITSSDDELNLGDLGNFEKRKFKPVGITLSSGGNEIHLVNNGNAANFLHGAVVGNFIYLVQAEIIIAAIKMIEKKYSNEHHEIDLTDRREITNKWLEVFS
jgi:adenosylhomocysteinase